ncbi:hypothetical protein [Pontibacter amylolyticus]|uniref:Uncharacterized protein n=1 Tax=Pontibacter amylolyticus TaxID=1424080 RepID=A0ABQ1VWY8_9BACT|nr:hypothetical protein [Pontibacter amylolyticus]GGG02189.1 hypothetical protein GCM10011323_03720 [Pontibacter amylolyticus]
MNKEEIISPEILSQIDWNKSIAQIIAEQCETTPNSDYFLASAIYLRLIPSFGYVKISYDFNELENIPDFSHKLLVEQVNFEKIESSLKLRIDNFRIERIELLGNRLKYSTEESDSFEVIQNLNEMFLSGSNFSLLIVPEFSTAQVRFTFAKDGINKYLEESWKESISDRAVALERIRKAQPNKS